VGRGKQSAPGVGKHMRLEKTLSYRTACALAVVINHLNTLIIVSVDNDAIKQNLCEAIKFACRPRFEPLCREISTS